MKAAKGRYVMLRDQMADLAYVNGGKVPDVIAEDAETFGAVDDLLPTPKARDGQAEGYEAGLRRSQPQLGTLIKGIAEGDERVLEDVALLPTPNTMEHREIKTPEQIAALKEKSPGGYRNLREVVVNELEEVETLLPTTTTGASQRNSQQTMTNPAKKAGVQLEQAIELAQGILPKEFVSWDEVSPGLRPDQIDNPELLPTTRVSMANGPTQKELDGGNPKHRLEAVTNWGKYQPAISRWERVLQRPAPAPTKPDGKNGQHRLAPEFTEWLMGLPEGWITGVGLTRVQELKAAGNGVVPQQAELALRILLDGLDY